MMYHHFAYIYDHLMKEAPYDDWAKFLHQSVLKYGNGGKRVLDLACGTGEISYRLAQLDYQVTGVDLSEDMLVVAKEKMDKFGYLNTPFFKQDMRELDGFPPYDHIFICCDSLNYLLLEEDVVKTFRQVYNHLNDEGLFIFDVHSVYKINTLFKEQTFADNDEKISYIWNCFDGTYENSVIHELTFFVKDGEKYVRYDEDHEQRTFTVLEYKQMLTKCGFQIVEVTSGLVQYPLEKAERIFFVAKKASKQ